MEFKENELDEILKAHLQKDDKVDIYKPRVLANIVNGFVNFKATWSWWAFFGTWGFFLYRKMYLPAVIIFLLSFLGGWLALMLMTISGVSAFSLYTKKLEKDLQIAGYNQREFSQVLETLKNLGGYHSWVIWLVVILNVLFFALVLLGFLGFGLVVTSQLG